MTSENPLKFSWKNRQMVAGSAFGYSRACHAMAAALEEAGAVEDHDADLAVTFTSASVFRRTRGKRNVLYCLAPETRILTADLRWVPVGDLQPGNELVGFDEDLQRGRGVGNKFRRATVQGVSAFRAPAYRIHTTTGSIVATGNHQWVVVSRQSHSSRQGRDRTARGTFVAGPRADVGKRRWCRTDELRPGRDVIVRRWEPWEVEQTYEAGWLAGFLDGEGTVSRSGNGNHLGFSQNAGPLLERACRLLAERGFTTIRTLNKVNERRYGNGCHGVQIHNGIRALGALRPERLLAVGGRLWEGQRTWGPNMPSQGEVLAVEPIGEVDVVGTMTSTGTLVAEGFLSHNTMTESNWSAPWIVKGLRKADAIIVPTEWNAQLFRRLVPAEIPVYVCPLGTFLDFYQGIDREPVKGRPFRWLWVGAHNERKGWRQVYAAWAEGKFIDNPNVELYMKTTRNPGESSPLGVQHNRNVFVDNRVIPEEQMLKLYVEADAFVFPSWGEGWGLPLGEAMATALPCCATLWGGVTEFADATVVRPIPYDLAVAQVHSDEGWLHYEPMALARTAGVVAAMDWIMSHPTKSKRMGHRAWQRIQNFGWPAAGIKLHAILREIETGVFASATTGLTD